MAINPASIRAHENYVEKFGFNFPICSDPDRGVASRYGALKPNDKGIQRTVIIVDKQGMVRYYKQGLPPTEELIRAIEELVG